MLPSSGNALICSWSASLVPPKRIQLVYSKIASRYKLNAKGAIAPKTHFLSKIPMQLQFLLEAGTSLLCWFQKQGSELIPLAGHGNWLTGALWELSRKFNTLLLEGKISPLRG